MQNKNQQSICKSTPRRAFLLSCLTLTFLTITGQSACYAGFGNLFGGNNDSTSNNGGSYNANQGSGDYMPPGTPGAGLGDPNPPKSLLGNGKKDKDDPKLPQNGDFTEDEKRVQHKWQDRIASDHRLIDRGEKMMKAAHDNPKSKDFQKGKVLKSIGEKDLADMKQNSPFPSPSIEEGKKTKPESL
jgi:hypothetical protein